MSAHPDPLDAGAILAALPEALAAEVASLHIAAQTVSTQADALAAAVPTRGCAVFVAEQQSGGQGRRGRRWISPPGGAIACSVSRRFDRPPAAMAGLSLAVGVALAEALHALGLGALRLKWPNDLVVEGRKLGGILVNLRAERDACSAVIGFGLNVRMPADAAAGIDQAWCDLAAFVDPPPRNIVLGRLLAHLLPALEAFDAAGLAPSLPGWQALDALVGQIVQLVEGDTHLVGLCLGVSADGALRLRHADGRVHEHHAGEASVRPA